MHTLGPMLGLALIAAAGNTADTKAKAGLASPMLLPVSDADTMKIRVSGCETWFAVGDTGYLFTQGSDFLLRIAAGSSGLKACHLPTTLADRFASGTTITCGGRSLSLRKLGQAIEHREADSVEIPAALTVRDGARAHTWRGRYGTAC